MVAQATWQARRFPPPWSVERSDACLYRQDHGGQAPAYVYFERGRRAVRPDASPPNVQRPAPARRGAFGGEALSAKLTGGGETR